MKRALLLTATATLMATVLAGCGLVSGTVFVSQGVDGTVNAQHGTAPGLRDGRRALDADNLGSVIVDLTDNDEWGKIDIDGIEDFCIRMDAVNHLDSTVSGEIWITLDVNFDTEFPEVLRANGFSVFRGIALLGNQSRTFTCENTLPLLENVDQLVEAVQIGKFRAWGIGNESVYDFTLSSIYFGMHVTGSL